MLLLEAGWDDRDKQKCFIKPAAAILATACCYEVMNVHALTLLTKDVRRDPRVTRETHTLEQAGIRVTVICLDRESDLPPIERCDTTSIHAVHVGTVRAGAPWSVAPALLRYYARAISQARRLHRATPFTVIHCHDMDSVLPGLLLSRQWDIPLIYDVHDLYSSYFKGPVLRSVVQRVDRMFYRCVDRVVITHESFVRETDGGAPSVILMNVPGLDGAGPVRDTATGLFYAGNLDMLRDMRWAIPVLTGSGIKTTFAGAGPLLHDYQRFASPGALDLLGWISAEEVIRHTRTCFAVLALYDSRIPNNRLLAPNKLFDAMKYGKPAIVSDNTTMAGIVREFECGVVVRYGDVDSLRAGIEQLCDDAAYRRMGENAYAAFTQNFNWEVMVRRLLSMYRELAGSSTTSLVSSVARSEPVV